LVLVTRVWTKATPLVLGGAVHSSCIGTGWIMEYIIYDHESGLEESSASSIEVADVRAPLRCTAVASAASFCSLSREFRLPPIPRILSRESLRMSKDQCTPFAPVEDVSVAVQSMPCRCRTIECPQK
jgi:hypothetical protein